MNHKIFPQLKCTNIPCHVPSWSDICLKHQVEGDGSSELISSGGGFDVVFHKKVRQLLLGVVV